MPKGLFVDAPRHAILKEYEEKALDNGQVRIRTEFASIKHGTFFHLFSGDSPFQHQRFDTNLRLFVPHEGKLPLVGQFLGHMNVGTVEACGAAVTSVKRGDRVYCFGDLAETVTRNEGSFTPVPASVSPMDVVCFDPTFQAFAAVRDARVVIGSTVVVFGLGAIGLCMVQILKHSGAMTIIAVDPMEKRRALATKFGADVVLNPKACDVAMEVRKILGQGADISIEASGSYHALKDAIRVVRSCARVVTMGYYSGGATPLELGGDYFHNRLELICSMPDWDNPNREYPIWDYKRMQKAVVDMFVRGWLTSTGILDPIVPFEQAAETFMRVYNDPSNAIKMGVKF